MTYLLVFILNFIKLNLNLYYIYNMIIRLFIYDKKINLFFIYYLK